MPHDGGIGHDGTLYFTLNNPNKLGTIGKVDRKTGAVSYIKADAANGRAAGAHGLVRDAAGNFWFDVNPAAAHSASSMSQPTPLRYIRRREYVATRRRGDDGRRRQRTDLGVDAERRSALRSGRREIH
jgi:hypothetical protein